MPEAPVKVIAAASLPAISDELVRLVTRGRGSLAFIFGGDDSRHRLLAGAINWDRVLLAFSGGRATGYAAIKFARRGPFSPSRAAFVREFGMLKGMLRFALFCLTECREWRYRFFLYGLRVDKRARRQGVATALLDAVSALAIEQGATRLQLEVLRHNLAAQQLYRHYGFNFSQPRRARWLPVVKMHRTLGAGHEG